MSEARQRWRLVFARDEAARYLSHLDAVHLWERAFRRGDIPVARSEGFSPRPRLIFGAPLPLGMLAEHELADLFLAERLTLAELRSRLGDGMPGGYRLIDLYDEWVGAPALATQIVAADYRLRALGAEPPRAIEAVAGLLGAQTLPRERRREKKVTRYDLRPLVLQLRVVEAAESEPHGGEAQAGEGHGEGHGSEPAARLWMRLRHSQERGSGRPEEVVAELADRLGLEFAGLDRLEADQAESPDQGDDRARPEKARITAAQHAAARRRATVEMLAPVRERLWLREELDVD